MGKAFVVKALAANFLIMVLAIAAPLGFQIGEVNSLFAALVGGTLIGVGLLLLMRHQVGIGGLGILALVLQNAFGWNAGRTIMIGDAPCRRNRPEPALLSDRSGHQPGHFCAMISGVPRRLATGFREVLQKTSPFCFH